VGSRRVPATFADVAAAPGSCGVELGFRPLRPDSLPERVHDVADLGPDPSVTTVRGLGKVLRLLRAARLARPGDPRLLLGRPAEAVALLERALGTSVVLRIRARAEVRFLAWTDRGVEAIGEVSEVLEGGDAWLVMRRNGRPPVRVARDAVVRTLTQCDTWYEVLDIQRA
jgi:hypothetical protein